jgi:hypothetical protein
MKYNMLARREMFGAKCKASGNVTTVGDFMNSADAYREQICRFP